MQLEYIINQTEMKIIVASNDKAKILLQMLDKIPTIKHIILMDSMADEFSSVDGSIQISSITDVEALGSQKLKEPNLPNSSDVCTICYTSGTTGLPKGAVLSHLNIMSFVGAAFELMKTGKIYAFSKSDSYLSYLPLAHVFERCVFNVLVYCGCQIGFYQGDTLKLMDDLAELKPTVFASVPRLYNRIYDKVLAGVSGASFLAKFLFNTAYNAKKANLTNGTVTHFLWDWLVFSKVRAKLGGRVKMMMSGAAPISADVMDFLRICFSATVQEGYGQTETSAGMTLVFNF